MKPILLGDSIFIRLFNCFPYHFDSISEQFCVSGQTILELKALVKERRELLIGQTVILMIGTNDFKSSVSNHNSKINIKSLIKLLSRLCSLITCEVPPYASESLSSPRNKSINDFNNFIHSMANITRILRTSSVFICDGKIYVKLFCQLYSSSMRVDLVHPNEEGLVGILNFILSAV